MDVSPSRKCNRINEKLAERVGFLPTLGRETDGSRFLFAALHQGWLLHHNPSPTFRTGDGRARSEVGHIRTILQRNRPILPAIGSAEDPRLPSFATVRSRGGELADMLRVSGQDQARPVTAVGCLQLLSGLNRVRDIKLCPFDATSVRVYRTILSRRWNRRITSLRDSAWVLKSLPRLTLPERRRRPPKDRYRLRLPRSSCRCTSGVSRAWPGSDTFPATPSGSADLTVTPTEVKNKQHCIGFLLIPKPSKSAGVARAGRRMRCNLQKRNQPIRTLKTKLS